MANNSTICWCEVATTLSLLISIILCPTRTPPLSAILPRIKLQIYTEWRRHINQSRQRDAVLDNSRLPMNTVSDVHGIKTAYKSQTSNASTARALNMRLSFRDKKILWWILRTIHWNTIELPCHSARWNQAGILYPACWPPLVQLEDKTQFSTPPSCLDECSK